MLQILSVFMVLGLSVSAVASSNKLVATCVGSYNQDMSSAEWMNVVLENGELWVRPAMMACHPVWCISYQVAKSQVKSNRQVLTAFEERRTLGLTTYRKTLNINFKTGKGLATHYVAFESLLKAKKIYLEKCVKK